MRRARAGLACTALAVMVGSQAFGQDAAQLKLSTECQACSAASRGSVLPSANPPVAPESAAPDGLRIKPSDECPGCLAASRSALQPGSKEAIVVVSVNLVPKGEFLVLITQDGDVLIRQEDVPRLALQGLQFEPIKVEGAAYVSTRNLPGVKATLDFSKLELRFQVAPTALAGRQVLDFMPPRNPNVIFPRPAGAFLNYNLVASGTDHGDLTAMTAAGEFGWRLGEWLISSDAFATHDAQIGHDSLTRLSTSATHDDRASLQRLVVGDFVTTPSTLGSTLRLGGVSFSKSYSIDPYLIRFPGQIVAGTAALPSEVFLYSNGTLISRQRIQPGQFELQNIVNVPGLQVTDVVVRDVLGNEQRIASPYYFTDALLRSGLDEYSFDVGFERKNFGVTSDDYGSLGASAVYRRGISADLTLGLRGETLDHRRNAGPIATWRAGRFGVVSAAYALGSAPGESGNSWFLGHSYAYRAFSSSMAVRRTSQDFPHAASGALDEHYNVSVNGSYAFAPGKSFSLGYLDTVEWTGDRNRSVLYTYRQLLAYSVSLIASWRNFNAPQAGNEITLGIAFDFDAFGRRQSGYAQTVRGSGSRTDSLQLAGGNIDAAGLYYTATVQHINDASGSRYSVYPIVQYNFDRFSARGEYFNDSTGSAGSYQASISGAVAGIEGHWGLSRVISDSFGFVKVDQLDGVKIYANGIDVGRTGADGTLFVPRLASYFENPLAIEDKDLPPDYIVPEVRYVVSPALRSGVLIDFKARRIQAVSGRLVAAGPGAKRPLANASGEISVAGTTKPIYTSRDGSFYVEDIGAGEYGGQIDQAGEACRFLLRVPASREAVVDLGAVDCK